MGPGAPVYFPEGSSLCDDGPDKRGMGASKTLFNIIKSFHDVKKLMSMYSRLNDSRAVLY